MDSGAGEPCHKHLKPIVGRAPETLVPGGWTPIILEFVPFQIVVCGSIVPDPLQTLEPVMSPGCPSLRNEMMLPAVLDPWAAHALYEAANLARQAAGSKVWLVSLGPKAKLQQVMMTVAQKVPFELVPLDGPASGFTDSFETAAALAYGHRQHRRARSRAIAGVRRMGVGLARQRGRPCRWSASAWASRSSSRAWTGSRCAKTDRSKSRSGSKAGGIRFPYAPRRPAVLGWATGYLPEPRNNPQVGMANMRAIMPALQRAKPAPVANTGLCFGSVSLPKQQRETRVVKNVSAAEIAREIVAWMREE